MSVLKGLSTTLQHPLSKSCKEYRFYASGDSNFKIVASPLSSEQGWKRGDVAVFRSCGPEFSGLGPRRTERWLCHGQNADVDAWAASAPAPLRLQSGPSNKSALDPCHPDIRTAFACRSNRRPTPHAWWAPRSRTV